MDIEKLKELEAKATRGRWKVFATEREFVGGHTRQVYQIRTEKLHPQLKDHYPVVCECEQNLKDGQKYGIWLSKEDAAFIVAMRNTLPALLASLASKDAEIERLKAERENARSEASHIAKMFLRHRDLLLEIRDKITDEGDRCYFGSTNHADYLRDVAAEMNDYAWNRYMRATKWPDYIEESRKANTRAEAAESRLTTALAALGETREALEPFACSDGCRCDQLQLPVDQRSGCPHRKARATLAKLNALEGNEDD